MKSVLILLVAVVAGMSAENCCFPDVFETDFGLIIGAAGGGQTHASLTFGKIAFDYTNKLAAEIYHSFERGVQKSYHVILDYKKGIQYFISLDESFCLAVDLPSTNMTHCIPDSAEPGGSSYLGKNELTQDSYTFTEQEAGGYASAFLSVTKDDCIPLSAVVIGESEGGGAMISGGFTGYVGSVKDPSSFFDVPSFCPKAVSKIEKQKMFKHHLNLLHL